MAKQQHLSGMIPPAWPALISSEASNDGLGGEHFSPRLLHLIFLAPLRYATFRRFYYHRLSLLERTRSSLRLCYGIFIVCILDMFGMDWIRIWTSLAGREKVCIATVAKY